MTESCNHIVHLQTKFFFTKIGFRCYPKLKLLQRILIFDCRWPRCLQGYCNTWLIALSATLILSVFRTFLMRKSRLYFSICASLSRRAAILNYGNSHAVRRTQPIVKYNQSSMSPCSTVTW